MTILLWYYNISAAILKDWPQRVHKMRITTRGRYAVTAMLDLSLHSTQQPVPLCHIADRQSISLSYLEQLFCRLRKSGLVKSVRGPGGGYLLGPCDSKISISQIIDAVGEGVDTTVCGGKGNCNAGEICLTHLLWDELGKEIHKFLSDISLADLGARQETQSIFQRQLKQSLNWQQQHSAFH